MYTTILFNNLVILAIYDPYSRKTRRSKFLNITQSDCSTNIVQDYAKIYSCGGSFLPVPITVLSSALSFSLPCYPLMTSFVFSY